ncbi:hypothetical protein D9M70_629850 [compost metagenome]
MPIPPASTCPLPQARPIMAESQMVAAVVRPSTRYLRSWWTITPAPMKPMPVRAPCTTRLAASAPMGWSCWIMLMAIAALREISAWVRSPAGRLYNWRLRPIRPPNSVANNRLARNRN